MQRASDIIVIGAGIAGASVANALAARGCSVTVLDRQALGGEASGGFAGLLTTVADGHATGPYAELSRRALREMLARVPELEERTRTPIELTRAPLLRVATDEASTQVQATYPLALDDQLVEGAALRALCPALAPNVAQAILSPVAHHLDPRRLLDATIASAKHHGAKVDLSSDVVAFTRAPSGRITGVVTERGEEWSADRVVLANGAWAPRLLAPLGVALALRPVRGQLVVLDGAAPGALPFIVASARGYLVPKRGGRIVVGATHEEAGFDKHATLGGMLHLSRVAAVLPRLLSLRIAETFVGLRPTAPDGMPLLGALPDHEGLTLALAYAQHGVLLSALCASLLADAITGAEPDPLLSPFAATRAAIQGERAA